MLIEIKATNLELCPCCGNHLADYSTCKVGVIKCFKCDTKITIVNASNEEIDVLKISEIIKD